MPSATDLVLFAYGAPPSAIGGFGWGFSPLPDGAVPFLGGSLLVNPASVAPVVTDPNGQASLAFGVLPADPALCGAAIYAQFAAADPDSPQGFDLSRGLRIRAGH